MTTELPPGRKLGKDGEPGETLSTSEWPSGTRTTSGKPYFAEDVENPEDDNNYDERREGEEIQPGDLVIWAGEDGLIHVYTEPEPDIP